LPLLRPSHILNVVAAKIAVPEICDSHLVPK
jgi:hypothetical protein